MADTTDQEMTEVPQNGSMDNGGGSSDAGENERKLFVGRLSWETTEKELQEHFSQFGEIESVSMKTDPATGTSRGFAFVVFKSVDTLNTVLESEHVINNKKVDPKKAKPRHGKIFVGGLDIDVTEEEIREYFGKFGTIVGVELPIDKMKNQRKNFCFVTFESETVTNDILKNPKQIIKSKEVDVKKANPKGPDGMMRGGGRGGRGGRGGPRGGRGGGWGQGYGGGYGNGYGYGGGGYGGYDYYGNGGGGYGGYNGGYGDYGSGYGGYGAGYGDAYGYGGGDGGFSRGGPRGGRGGKGFGGGKQRGGGGGGRGSRPTPY